MLRGYESFHKNFLASPSARLGLSPPLLPPPFPSLRGLALGLRRHDSICFTKNHENSQINYSTMPSKTSIDDDDTPSTAAVTTHTHPSTGGRRHTRSQGSLPNPVDLGTQDMARPCTPPPPPAPNESADLSVDDLVDDRSPPLLSNPDDVNFTVVQARGKQRVTPLQLVSPTQAVHSPTPTGNSFSAVIGHGILAGTYLAEYRDSLK